MVLDDDLLLGRNIMH